MTDRKTCWRCGAFLLVGDGNTCEDCEYDDPKVDIGGGMVVRLSELMDDD